MRTPARPWLCPERRCTPLIQCTDGDYKDLTVPEPGYSWTCWGLMERPVAFTYDGVEHTNNCNACHYTPLKGLIRWQENPTDWETLSSYYALAAKKARAALDAPEGETTE